MRRAPGLDALREQVVAWFDLWALHLSDPPEVVVNPRLRRARGRCRPESLIIELRPDIARRASRARSEALCHEAAHLAAAVLHPAASPHGDVWRNLMRSAGFEPAAASIRVCRIAPAKKTRPLKLYDHVCPVCHASRTSKRPVRRWRCARCVRAGLPGEMIIRTRQGEVAP